jgi:hypothetical protein
MLEGIEALGQTCNQNALDYLRSAAENETCTGLSTTPTTHAKDSVHPETDFEHYTCVNHPKAQGKLNKMLQVEDNGAACGATHCNYGPVHERIICSIKKLEATAKPMPKNKSNRDDSDKSDDNRTFSGTGYP